jgi:dipeptidyl-peptidase-4
MLVAAWALIAAPAFAEKLPLDRLFASPSLAGPSPRALKLSPDGKLATLLRSRPADKDRFDLWAIDTTTAKQRMLVDSEKVGSGAAVSEAEKMRRERAQAGNVRGIVDYDWAPDGKSLLVPIDGDLYLATLDGKAKRLTDTPATEIAPTLSQDGGSVAFVREQNVFAIALATGKETQLTSDGGGALSWGMAEFVAQEELDRSQGLWWSPRGDRIAIERSDESGVLEVTRAAIGADGTIMVKQRYPRAGTPNAKVELWLMASDGSARVKADLGKDPDIYLARVDWAADGRSLYVQRLSRDQKSLDLLVVDAATGASRILFSERSDTWLNLIDNNLRVLGDGSLLWVSARDGWPRLYRWQAGKWTALTKGPWEVTRIVGVDEAYARAYVIGTRDSPLERHLYAIDIRRLADPARLTEPGFVNEAEADAYAGHFIIRRSSATQPPQVYLADATGRRTMWVNENRVAGDHPLARYADALVAPQYGTMKATDGQILHWQMLKPPVLEPGKHYPVLFYVYGGPHQPIVQKQWLANYTLPFDYLVQQGWIVFNLDNRGTSFRGTAFDAPIYHALGGPEVADQLAALKWLKEQPFVDPARVVVLGKSYGGYMTLKLLEAAPGQFAGGVAISPVTRWGLYDTAYTERYLGDPNLLPKVYEASDVLPRAARIADPLLLIHGMADDNVAFENSTALMAKLQSAKIPFDLMTYPGTTHFYNGEAVQTHLWTTITRFLDERRH